MFFQLVITCVLLKIHVYPATAEHLLVLALPFYSHTRNLIKLTEDVTQTYGHTATVVTSTKTAERLKLHFYPGIDIVLSDALDKADFEETMARIAKEICDQRPSMDNEKEIFRSVVKTCDDLHRDTMLLKHLNSREFKLAILDGEPMGECFASLAFRFSIPYIFFGTLYDPVRMRIPFSPASFPSYRRLVISEKTSFAGRLHNVIAALVLELAPGYLGPDVNVEKYVPNSALTANQLISKASFHLVETDFLLDHPPRPSLPHVAFIGGISTQPSKPLPEIFQAFVDSSEYGVVVVSFGSELSGFPQERIDTLIKAFKRRSDLNFIVKYSVPDYAGDNIMFSDWIPQNDLLGHPKTVLFITHCGNNGQSEALYHGIPMVGFPINNDQFVNCEHMKRKGYGVVLDFCLFSCSDVENALEEVLTQMSYTYSIRNASQIFRSRSDSPLQRASYWVDHVTRYGNKYIHSYSVDLPWYQYYLLDLFTVVTLFFLVASYSIAVLYFRLKYICSRQNDKNVKDKTKHD